MTRSSCRRATLRSERTRRAPADGLDRARAPAPRPDRRGCLRRPRATFRHVASGRARAVPALDAPAGAADPALPGALDHPARRGLGLAGLVAGRQVVVVIESLDAAQDGADDRAVVV